MEVVAGSRQFLCMRTSQVLRDDVSCRLMKTPDTTSTPVLPFQLDPEPATETLTALGGLPLVAQTFRSLGLPQSVARHLPLKQRQRGLDEATMIESVVLLNAAGGDCLEDFRRLAEDPGLPTLLGHALPLPDAARKFLYAFHRDEAIATAKAQRPAGQVAFIPEDTEPLQGLAHVNVDLVRAVAARCPWRKRPLPRCRPRFRSTTIGATRPVMNTRCSRGCAIRRGPVVWQVASALRSVRG